MPESISPTPDAVLRAGTSRDERPTEGPSGWQELNDAYQERFGIPPEKATPPPSG